MVDFWRKEPQGLLTLTAVGRGAEKVDECEESRMHLFGQAHLESRVVYRGGRSSQGPYRREGRSPALDGDQSEMTFSIQ